MATLITGLHQGSAASPAAAAAAGRMAGFSVEERQLMT